MVFKRGKRCLLRLIRILLDMVAQVIGWRYPAELHYLPAIHNPILLVSATEISRRIKSGKLKSEDVVKAFIDRCVSVQPLINAIVQDNYERALEEARRVDIRVERELAKGGPGEGGQSIQALPFLGVPFTAKDSMAVKGMFFTSGLYTRKGITADEDCANIALMRKSGAIFIAMTNVPELVMWWDTYNMLYGRTYNPYDRSRICGGSSGGEAALISSAGSVIGVGADIGGSIRMPCFFCGIFGHKTTPDVINVQGLYPAPSPTRRPLLSIGPMTRYACDLKPMLKVLAGSNARKLDLDKTVDLKKVKFYYMEGDGNPFHTPVQPEISDAMHRVLGYYNRMGATSKKVFFKQFRYGLEIWMCAMDDPSSPKTARELANLKGEINPWWEFLKSFFGRSKHTFCAISLCISELFLKTFDKRKYVQMRRDLSQELHKLLGKDGVLVFPAHPEPAVKHNQTFLKVWNVSYTQLFNPLNVAITSVPLGLSRNGLPIGLQFVAAPMNDRLTIAVAEDLEREFGGWVSPSHVSCC